MKRKKKTFEKVISIDDKHIRAFKNYFLITKVDAENKYLKTGKTRFISCK